MEDANIPTPPDSPGAVTEGELDLIIKAGRGERWTRAAINFLATAITSAMGGPPSLVMGVIGGGIGAATGIISDKKQAETNKLLAACAKEMRESLEELRGTVMQVIVSIKASEDQFVSRVEDPRYQELIRKAFTGWSRGQSDEKREMIRRLLAHAAEVPDPDYDLFKLFFDWLQRYNELHFRVIRAMKEANRPTRLQIWELMGGSRIRDDSAEADVFKCLILDLTFGHVIRQAKEKAAGGQLLKKARKPTRNASPYMKSAIDDKDEYELTAVGQLFIHYTMEELIQKLPPTQQ
jgi:hypothetical protein